MRFRPLENAEIRRYVVSGEPLNKPGAYGIQGRAAIFVEEIRGSYTGIIGYPFTRRPFFCDATAIRYKKGDNHERTRLVQAHDGAKGRRGGASSSGRCLDGGGRPELHDGIDSIKWKSRT